MQWAKKVANRAEWHKALIGIRWVFAKEVEVESVEAVCISKD